MNIVVIGGGTGSFTVLRGLKDKANVSAVVSMFDSGGSTGRLRDEFGMLPPGDVRRCLVALAQEDDILRKLFNYRFDEKSSLKGHSFGNLFIAALKDITGSEQEAIRQAEKILRIKGKVLPVSFDNCELCAKLEDESIVRGENNIDVPKHNPNLKIVKVWLEPQASANKKAVDAILKADKVVIGPGDLYTSVIPNLLVKGIPEALEKTKAQKVYICNLMTKPGETTNFKASDHLKEIMKYGCSPTAVICNSAQGPTDLLKKYAKEQQFPVEVDEESIKKIGVKLIKADVMSAPDLIRHDSVKLATILLSD